MDEADDRVIEAIQEFLADRPELLKDTYSGERDHPLEGHCYVATEALYAVIGERDSRFTPHYVHYEDTTHWFLRDSNTGDVLDITSEQFETDVPYEDGQACGFQKFPSNRATVVLESLVSSSIIEDCELV